MIPILLEIGFIKIYTFGIFLVLAFFWGCFFLWKNIRLTSYKEETVFDGLFFALIVGGFIGRLVFVILNFSDFGFDILRFILINGYPGFSLPGFLVGFFIGFYVFCVGQKIRFLDFIDYVIPALFLAMAIGKVGSFFAGVEVGSETTLPVAVRYANFDGMRHLTPLYEGILLFLGSFFAFRMLFSIRREILDRGFLFHFFLWYAAAVYFSFDWIRAEREVLYGYSVYMLVSAGILLTFSLYFLYYFRTAFGQSLLGSSHKKHHGKPSFPGIHPTAKKETRRGSK